MLLVQVIAITVIMIHSVTVVHADHDPNLPPEVRDEVEDILNVVVIDAQTQMEKEVVQNNIKQLIKDITDIAQSAVRVFNENKKLFGKVAKIFERSEGMRESNGDVAAVELLQTTLLIKFQELLLENDGSAQEGLLISDGQSSETGLANATMQ